MLVGGKSQPNGCCRYAESNEMKGPSCCCQSEAHRRLAAGLFDERGSPDLEGGLVLNAGTEVEVRKKMSGEEGPVGLRE